MKRNFKSPFKLENNGESMKEKVFWKSHLCNLFEEVLKNPGAQILEKPLQLTLGIIKQAADRAIELDDPVLLFHFSRLSIYEISDPQNKKYDPDILNHLIKKIEQEKNKPSELDIANKRIEELENAIKKIPVCECSSWARVIQIGKSNGGHHPECKLYKPYNSNLE